jgi:two-component system, sensor histidine kinase and response regulator
MAFHYPSLMFFSSLVSFLIVILYLCFILFTKNYKLNIVLFTIGRGLIAFGIIGIAFRDNLPDFISLILSNILILSGTGATILGILSYNKPVAKKMVWILAAIVIGSSLLYMMSISSYSHRSFIIYISMSLMVLIGSAALFWGRESFKFPIFISIVMLLFGIGRIAFAIQHLGLPDDFNPMIAETFSQLFVPIFSILSLAISVGFLLLLREVDVRIIQNKNEELKRLNINKDKLFKMIAHDLRAPFNNILGFSEILLESTEKDSIKEIQNFAQKINHSAQIAFDSTNGLLEWVMTNTINIEPDIKRHHIKNFIHGISIEFSNRIKEKNLVLDIETAESLEGSFDKNMVGSILRNLLSNAIKFSPENKRLKIKAENINNYLEFKVIDQGTGIAKDHFKTIFSADPKTSSPGTKGESGSGLGLSICKDFVKKHDGEIWVESELGKGCCFTFTIPSNNP